MDEVVHFAMTLPKLILLSRQLCSGQAERTELLDAAEPGLSPATVSFFSPHGLSRVSGARRVCASNSCMSEVGNLIRGKKIAKHVLVATIADKISLTVASFLMAWGPFRDGQDGGEGADNDEKEKAKGLEVCRECMLE